MSAAYGCGFFEGFSGSSGVSFSFFMDSCRSFSRSLMLRLALLLPAGVDGAAAGAGADTGLAAARFSAGTASAGTSSAGVAMRGGRASRGTTSVGGEGFEGDPYTTASLEWACQYVGFVYVYSVKCIDTHLPP